MTEDEALDKWCPMVRIERNGAAVNEGVFANKAGEKIHRATTCIASGCAVWRFDDAKHGYCGLAGIQTKE